MSIRGGMLFVAVALPPGSGYGVTQVLLFGGGPTPYESQVSIELNTRWIHDVLERRHPDAVIHTLYTDGNAPGVDVRGWSPVEGDAARYQPLADVFGAARENGYRYHSSRIAADTAPSDSLTVTQTLESLVADSRAGDDVLLVYQGHGAYAPHTERNSLLLWGDTPLTVTELEALLSAAAPGVTVRFVLPQCFSGAFTRLIYAGAQPQNGLAEGLRCGFVSQQEDRPSEGCTDSVETGDYRDYSSYFFSALDGRARDGDPLAGEPDRNGDGRVTLREAHLYTLENASSVDFSRSTSQDYLERWQPWYLRWLPFPADPDNEYSRIAARLAARYDLPAEKSKVHAAAEAKRQEVDAAISGLRQEKRDLQRQIQHARRRIRQPLLMRWPALQSPYTAGFQAILREQLPQVRQAILAQEDYPELVADQERLAQLQEELLAARRDRVQLEKLLWMRKLARILAQFERYASAQAKEEYARLVRCEEVPL